MNAWGGLLKGGLGPEGKGDGREPGTQTHPPLWAAQGAASLCQLSGGVLALWACSWGAWQHTLRGWPTVTHTPALPYRVPL